MVDPDCYSRVRGRVSVDDFGPDEHLKELGEAIFDIFENESPLTMSNLYARIESPQTAKLIADLQAAAQRKENICEQLEGALIELENRRRKHQNQIQTIANDRDLKNVLRHISEKGPNLRSAGI